MIRLVVVVEALVVSLSLVQGRNLPENQGCKVYFARWGLRYAQGSLPHTRVFYSLSTSIRQQVSEHETFDIYGNSSVRHMSHVRILVA